MSDLSGLHGIYPNSLRWNAETGFLAISVFNVEIGGRELQEIELGQPATFALDLATRERGYGLIKTGVYNMTLTPVGSPLPAWPGDKEYKPAIGCWLWNPTFGELRLETNARTFREAVNAVWDECRSKAEAAEGLQPVIRFVDRVPVPVKTVNKTFSGPVIKTIAWVERDKVPGWRERAPTVSPPAAPPLLSASSAPAPATPEAKKSIKAKPAKAKQGGGPKPGPDDSLSGFINDDIPWK
jgi:hypothetical protein